jgi:hypothetical protein
MQCARQNPLDARKIRRQFLAARMLAGSFRRSPHRRVLRLHLLDHFTDDGRKLEQLHLCLRKFFSARSIFLDPRQPQSLFQHPNPQPKHEEFRSRTIWSLSNAFTFAFKELDPIPQFKATAKLGEFPEARFSQSF